MSNNADAIKVKSETSFYNPFTAVFLPVFLALLGVGFFLRLGYVVGSAGIIKTVVIITISTLISFITALSLSTTATNIQVKTGGIYFLLSRIFGIEISAAISLPLFVSQAIGLAFYVTGFSEALHLLVPTLPVQLIGLGFLALVTLIAFISSRIVMKLQFFIFICICLTLTSFYLGGLLPEVSAESLESLPKLDSFWVLFAVFFPAVTGIEGGLTLAANLKNPSKSVPIGTISSVFMAYLIYISVALLLYYRVPNSILVSNSLIMKEVALVPAAVIMGILGATFSAALSTLLGAAKTMQAFAEDGILPKFLGKEFGKNKFPKLALIISAIIGLFGMSLGGINTIAPILTTFSLISYGMLNAANALEGMIANPSYRPTLKMPWIVSLLGAILCFVVMLLIDSASSIVAFTFVIVVYILMKRRHMTTGWEDLRYSILLFLSRFAIYRLGTLEATPKTWRPHLLVFVGDPLLRAHLIAMTSALTHNKGFLIMASVSKTGSSLEEKKLELFLQKAKIPALVKVQKEESFLCGLKNLIDNIGIGPITPNTIVLGASKKSEKIPVFSEVIREVYKKGKNLLLISENNITHRLLVKKHWKTQKQIDVWWAGGCKNNSELMIVLAYMLKTSKDWQGAKLTLKTAVSHESDTEQMKEKLAEFCASSRLSFATEVVLHKEGDILSDTIKQSSSKADLVFLGLRPPYAEETNEDYSKYYENLMTRTNGYPPIAYVLASEDIDFSNILN